MFFSYAVVFALGTLSPRGLEQARDELYQLLRAAKLPTDADDVRLGDDTLYVRVHRYYDTRFRLLVRDWLPAATVQRRAF